MWRGFHPGGCVGVKLATEPLRFEVRGQMVFVEVTCGCKVHRFATELATALATHRNAKRALNKAMARHCEVVPIRKSG